MLAFTPSTLNGPRISYQQLLNQDVARLRLESELAKTFELELLLDQLIGASKHRGWHRDPERLRSLEIDNQLKFRGQLDGQLCWLVTFQDATGIHTDLTVGPGQFGSIAH